MELWIPSKLTSKVYGLLSKVILCFFFTFLSPFLFYFSHLSDSLFCFILLLLLFKYSCPHFNPTTLPHPTHPHFSPSILSPFGFVHGSFMHVPWWPFPLFSSLSSSPSPLCDFLVHIFSLYFYAFLWCLSWKVGCPFVQLRQW